MIIKTRLKSRHSQFLLDNIDYIFFEETFYPPTITELLYVSDIAISHFSMATFESIAMKSYKININLEPVFDIFTDHFRFAFLIFVCIVSDCACDVRVCVAARNIYYTDAHTHFDLH